MRGLGGVGPEVEDVVRLLTARERVALLRVDEVGELDRVLDEEHRGVVADEVVVALLGVELHREAARVADRVRAAEGVGHGGEAQEDLGAPADRAQEVGVREAADVVGHLEVAVGAGAAGVHDALRDALAVEAGELLDEVLVLDQEGAADAGGSGVLVVGDRGAGLGGEHALRHRGPSVALQTRGSADHMVESCFRFVEPRFGARARQQFVEVGSGRRRRSGATGQVSAAAPPGGHRVGATTVRPGRRTGAPRPAAGPSGPGRRRPGRAATRRAGPPRRPPAARHPRCGRRR